MLRHHLIALQLDTDKYLVLLRHPPASIKTNDHSNHTQGSNDVVFQKILELFVEQLLLHWGLGLEEGGMCQHGIDTREAISSWLMLGLL